MPRAFLVFLAAVLAAAVSWARPWAPDPLQPVSSGGLEAVERALARLSVNARLLVVGAHPDDEDNALLTWVARGLGGEAAYLSLSRGEGGQNLIGPELGVELGAIRTGELLAARRLEGSRQYFARAYDFGYTRSLEETFERWPRETLQEDALRVARRFKPQVIVAVFPASERAGHGQHQASAVIAADLYEMTGDGDTLPRLADPPWTPRALYRRAWMRWGEPATHEYSLAALDPVSGRSLGQLAAASRSFHRSQDMGREQLAGPARGGLVWIAGGAGDPEGREGGARGPFDGIDTRLQAMVETAPAGPARDRAAGLLTRVADLATAARGGLTPAALDGAVPALAEIVDLLAECGRLLDGDDPGSRAARALVAEKAEVAAYGLAAAAGVVLEATAERETVPEGGVVEVEGAVWPAGEPEVVVRAIETVLPERAWRAAPVTEPGTAEGVVRQRFRVEVPPPDFDSMSVPTMPYYLREIPRSEVYPWPPGEEPPQPRYRRAVPRRVQLARSEEFYDLLGVPEEVRGEPFGPPPVRLRFTLEIAGRPVTLTREAVYRFADQAYGERRRPLRVVPPIEVSLEPALHLLAGESAATRLAATVRGNRPDPQTGRLRLDGRGAQIAGELAKVHHLFRFDGEGASDTLRAVFDAPADPGRYQIRATVESSEGERFTRAMRLIAYPHIRPVAVPVRAVSELIRFDLALPPLDRVGYVRGASDRVPEVLAALGVPIEMLDADALDRGDLSGFDAIVVGSRAYETDEALRRANPRLLEYARAGGRLIVQYQQYQFVRGGYAPFPLEILRPHGRVTDELAPVEALAPDHPALHRPNRITEADWDGWVQERGLYFAGSWDEAYQPLLSLADPGREAERGALLVAPVGEGTYVYTGLSFFRQLPAGVAGAVRLFVNLLALGER